MEKAKITDEYTRKSIFNKRRKGLIKKAYELSVLCDIDVVLMVFSPTNKLFHFSGKNRRLEDVLMRFLDLPNVSGSCRDGKIAIKNKADLISLLQCLKDAEDVAAKALREGSKPKTPEDRDEEIEDIEQNPLDSVKNFIREELNKPVTSPDDFNCRHKNLLDLFNQVQHRKKYLISNVYPKPATQRHEMSQLQHQHQSVPVPNDAALLSMQHQQEEAFEQGQELTDFIQQQTTLMPMDAALQNLEQRQEEAFMQVQEMLMSESNHVHMTLDQEMNLLHREAEFAHLIQNNNKEMPIQTPSETDLLALKEEPWNSDKNDSIGPGCDDPFSDLEPIIEEKDLCLVEPTTMSSHANAYTSSYFIGNTWNSELTSGPYHSFEFQLRQQQQSVQMPNNAALLNMQQQQEEAFKQDQELADFIRQQQQPILMPMDAALHNMQQQQEAFKQEQEMVINKSNSANMPLHQQINRLRIEDEFTPLRQNNSTDMPIQTSSKTNLLAFKEEPWNCNKNDSIGPYCNDLSSYLEPIVEENDQCLIEPSTISSHAYAYAYASSSAMENTWNSDMTNESNHSFQDHFGVPGDASRNFPNFEGYDNSGN